MFYSNFKILINIHYKCIAPFNTSNILYGPDPTCLSYQILDMAVAKFGIGGGSNLAQLLIS